MKITDLVGRLTVKYPGICSTDAENYDGYYLYMPHQFRVFVATYELVEIPDDALVATVERDIEDATRCANA